MNGYRKSQRQEKRGAALLGGSRNAGSGNKERKNDVRAEDISVEYKYTDKKSYSLKLDELLQAEKHALLDGREMLFGIEMGGRHFVVLSEDYYVQLRGRS